MRSPCPDLTAERVAADGYSPLHERNRPFSTRVMSPVAERRRGAARGTQKVGQGADEVRHHSAFRALARLGLVSRAVVYLLVGALVIEIALRGRSSSAADSQGAFAAIARQPAGPEVLGLVAFGLAAYALWRFVESVSRVPQGGQVSVLTRLGWGAIGALYVFLCVNAADFIAGSQPDGPEQHPSSLAAGVLALPGGPALLGAMATALVAGGIGLIVWACIHRYTDDLERGRMGSVSQRSVRATGVGGNLARGSALLLVASFLFASAVSGDPNQAKPLDAALQSLAGSAAGAVFLGLLGLGFLAFSAFSVIEARFRQV